MSHVAVAEDSFAWSGGLPVCGETPQALARDGYALVEPGDEAALQMAERFFEHAVAESASGSSRLSCDDPLVALLLEQPAVRGLVRHQLGPDARPVRALAFDKTMAANWFVPWHQDRSIAVDQKRDCDAVGNWTEKAGVAHCEPPLDLLRNMLTLRWHLDDVGIADGCLRVLPGSHRLGRLDQTAIRALRQSVASADIVAPRGSVMLASPLLVHGSRKRSSEVRRRTLQVELSAMAPPAPLRWASA